jgi:hypothetical protein
VWVETTHSHIRIYNDDAVFRIIHIILRVMEGRAKGKTGRRRIKNKITRRNRKERLDFFMVSSVKLLLDGLGLFSCV